VNKIVIRFPSHKFFGLALLVLLIGRLGYADELDSYVSAQKQRCEERTRELEQRKQQLQAEMQSQSATQAAPEARQHLAATQQAIDRMHVLLTQASPQTAAEKETYARALSVAGAQISVAKRIVEKDLHIDPASVIERMIDQNAQKLNQMGQGAPSSNVGFDGSRPRTQSWDTFAVGGPQPFQPYATPVTEAQYTPMTVDQAKQVQERYGSIPQGVALEGIASGLAEFRSAHYDAAYNAIVLDDRAVYFVRIAPWTFATLCRAIAEDDQERVGISYGRTFQAYGKTPLDSKVAQDLILADKFLADIVFAENDWTVGYKFQNGFVPEKRANDKSMISVSFKFYGFKFEMKDRTIVSNGSAFDIKLYPISSTPAKDGGAQPDYAAIQSGRTFPEYERNASHLSANIRYYRQERIVNRAFLYGETAALLRALKAAHVSLGDLASQVLGT